MTGAVVALVPVRDGAGTIGETVAALASLAAVGEVVVVDDGSVDGSAQLAAAAGARVVRLVTNVGKGGAVAAGVEATPDAEVYLLVDADVGGTAAAAAPLLDPVLDGRADLVIGVLPPAGRRGGLGAVRRLARAGIVRGSRGTFDPRAPLSGQRAARAELLRRLDLAEGFGLEAAMTLDAARVGARIVEIDVGMDHRHTGRSLAGFRHRGVQGLHLVRALWPRLTTPGQRIGAIGAAFGLVLGAMVWSGSRWEPSSVAAAGRPSKVVIFGVPRLGWDDLGTGTMPNLDGLATRGAVAAMSVRTAGRASTVEGYATLGAGARVQADAAGGDAYDADAVVEGGTAAAALARRSGSSPPGEVVVVGAPAVTRLNQGRHLPSLPGALGDALAAGVRRTAVVGNADVPRDLARRPARLRPTAVALMTSGGSVDGGTVGERLSRLDPEGAFGVRADPEAVVTAFRTAVASADVVLVDPGDMDRAAEFAALAAPAAASAQRRAALAATDDVLGRVVRIAGPDALVLVVSVVPPGPDWHLTPVVAAGSGVVPGYLHSLSTRRLGVVTLTDVAPTVLAALGLPPAPGMIGQPLRFHPGSVDLDRLAELDRDAAFREDIYLELTTGYVFFQALVYLLAAVAFSRLGGAGRAGRPLRLVVLGVSAWPLATFVLRAVPDVAVLGAAAVPLLFAIDIAIVSAATRFRRRPLGPLAVIAGATVVLLVVDVATGARLQGSSLLGYSLHTAARFTGFGNTAFAVLGSTAILAAALHVHHAPRRREALVTAAGLMTVVAVADGAPSLGADVGGILTLVPVFALTLLALAGRRISPRTVASIAVATVLLLGLATGVDLLRPAGSRTHLGRLVSQVADRGWEPLTTTVSRKASVNFRTYRSPWAWTVPIVAAYMLYVLAWARGWSRLLPPQSALRAAVVGVLATGLLGYAVNDSGIVVTALVFVYIGPFLTLLALAREREDRLLPAAVAVATRVSAGREAVTR
ncbi:MAG: glycosyltransferase [Acidimicrobiales bacterium]